MTRFARKGRTKALEATPWAELKKGIKYDWKEGDDVNQKKEEEEEVMDHDQEDEEVEKEEGGEKGSGEKEGEEKVDIDAGEGEKKKKKKKKNKKKKKPAENAEGEGENVEGDASKDDTQSKKEKKSKKEEEKEKEKERLLKRREQRKNRRNRHKTCLGCRARGHVITECPKVKGTVTGICYKCGSTQHKTAGCRKKVDPNGPEFPFAVCFICKEKGHLTRSCPDNPRGLYPKGGCCGTCGSVEHLKQNCPENNKQKEETSIRLSTRDTHASVEDDDDLENHREDEEEKAVKTKTGGFKAVNQNRDSRLGGSHPYSKPKSVDTTGAEDRSESVAFSAPKPKAKPVKVVKF